MASHVLELNLKWRFFGKKLNLEKCLFEKKLCAAEYILLLIGWTVEIQCIVGFSAVIRVYIGRSSFLKALTFYVYILQQFLKVF